MLDARCRRLLLAGCSGQTGGDGARGLISGGGDNLGGTLCEGGGGCSALVRLPFGTRGGVSFASTYRYCGTVRFLVRTSALSSSGSSFRTGTKAD